jgi:hypothetical protein
MSTDLVVSDNNTASIFHSSPKATVLFATELANALAPIIDQQKMYTLIQGKKHVKCEGWLTLGAMVGILPREVEVKELPDGSYEARVDLLNKDGRVVGGASALCGVEEQRWSKADRYARRSMAVTRATVKSYRLAFAWLIQLAGFQPTPSEEMPEVIKTDAKTVEIYSGTPTEISALKGYLTNQGVHVDKHAAISEAMLGRPKSEISQVIKEQK